MTQKSWPSGAPARAAAACMAETPGTMRTGTPAKRAPPSSMASYTAAAIAKMPGSPDETGPLFDRRSTPSLMGLLTETFRGRDNVTRSIHATHSLAVTGPGALDLTRDHYRLDAPCGAGSPFARLLERNASVLMFGVTFMHYTLCHTAEDASGSSYAYQGGTIDRLRVVDEHGAPCETRSRRQARTPRRFEEAGEALIRNGLARQVTLGKGALRYVPDCVKVHDWLVERLRRHPDYLQRACAQSLD